MKVKELREQLEQIDPDIDVIMQKDSEGNGYSPLSGIDANCIYTADSTWSGEIKSTEWTADEACFDSDDWENFKNDNPRCLVLYPVN